MISDLISTMHLYSVILIKLLISDRLDSNGTLTGSTMFTEN